MSQVVNHRDPAQVFINALREVGLDVQGAWYNPGEPLEARLSWVHSSSLHRDEATERLVHRAVSLAMGLYKEIVCYDCFSYNGGHDYGTGCCNGTVCEHCPTCGDER